MYSWSRARPAILPSLDRAGNYWALTTCSKAEKGAGCPNSIKFKKESLAVSLSVSITVSFQSELSLAIKGWKES